MPLVVAKLVIRGFKAPAYWQRWSQRFGFFPYKASEPTLWVHAVSVGEAQAAVPLIKALLKRYPQYKIVVTTMTPTGLAHVEKTLGDSVISGHLPYDLPGSIERFLKRINPAIAVIMETELWPNLFHACHRADIPILIANARLSPGSTRGYKRIQFFAKQVLANVSCVAAQTQGDAERYVEIGADESKVIVTNNIKFDMKLPDTSQEVVEVFRHRWGNEKKVWVAASTHAGEDEIILDAHTEVLKHIPEAVLILVPRHPERFNDVAQLVTDRGFSSARRSTDQLPAVPTQVFVGDTMGELMFFYQLSDVAFVGGSFVATGGHNVLEPAALGLPTVVGPHTFNFKDITQAMVKAGATMQLQDQTQLSQCVIELLRNSDKSEDMGCLAEKVIKENQGATGLLLEQLGRLMEK